MAGSGFNNVQTEQIARSGLKQLIKNYNMSGGTDQKSLQIILEYIGKTPLYIAIAKGSKKDDVQIITLSTPNAIFVPIFTSPEEMGKLKDDAEVMLMAPADYIPIILQMNHHAVINPFGDYFLLWPELMREHMLPYIQEHDAFTAQTFGKGPVS